MERTFEHQRGGRSYVAVKKAATAGFKFDQHVSAVGRDIDVQNPVVTSFGKEVFPFDLAGIKAEARRLVPLLRSGCGSVHYFSSCRRIAGGRSGVPMFHAYSIRACAWTIVADCL
jgi:hypothetical protein